MEVDRGARSRQRAWAAHGGERAAEPGSPAREDRGSVCGPRQGAVRGYRKARDVRAPEGRQVERFARALGPDRPGIAQHHPAEFAGGEAAQRAGGHQPLLEHRSVRRQRLEPAVALEMQGQPLRLLRGHGARGAGLRSDGAIDAAMVVRPASGCAAASPKPRTAGASSDSMMAGAPPWERVPIQTEPRIATVMAT
jgi:hypothetical protein